MSALWARLKDKTCVMEDYLVLSFPQYATVVLFRGLVRFFNLFSMQQDYDKGEAILVFTVG